MKKLETEFTKEILEKTRLAKGEYGYNATRFTQMLGEYGAVETAKRLIAAARVTDRLSDGFAFLCSKSRLDLTIEDSVRKPKYRELFTSEEIDFCNSIFEKK